MPQAGYRTAMLLALVFVIGGCDSGNGGGQTVPPPSPAQPSPPGEQPPPTTPPPPSEPPPTTPPPSEPPPTTPPPAISGLDARPSNTTCIAPQRATGSVTIGTQPAFPNLGFRDPATRASYNPILMLQAPGDTSRWFVAGKVGIVQVFDNREDVAATSDFLDIRARVESSCAECGFL